MTKPAAGGWFVGGNFVVSAMFTGWALIGVSYDFVVSHWFCSWLRDPPAKVQILFCARP